MSNLPRYQTHYTVDDYQSWQGDWELWHGAAIAMTPSPFGRHARLLIDTGAALKAAIDAGGCDATVLGEIDWIVSQDTVLRPDLLVVCGREPERHVEQVPAIVVEILSENTRQRDLIHKRSIYEQQAVPFYLIVDPDESKLTALQLNAEGAFAERTFADELPIDLCDNCHIQVNVTGLFR